jgi:hypothetical protein
MKISSVLILKCEENSRITHRQEIPLISTHLLSHLRNISSSQGPNQIFLMSQELFNNLQLPNKSNSKTPQQQLYPKNLSKYTLRSSKRRLNKLLEELILMRKVV